MTGGVVRPFRARIVRQECAARNVFRMLDALPQSERPPGSIAHAGGVGPVDLDGYEESGPALYVYRLRRGADVHVGVVAEVAARAFVDGRVRGHEAVQPGRVDGLVDHFTSAAVRSELVALLHDPGPVATAALVDTLAEEPLTRFTGPDGWEQTVWRVAEATTAELGDELGSAVHYIADGHHRVAASLRVWDRDGQPDEGGLMCVIYPFEGLRLLSFHRRVIGPADADAVLGLLAGSFEVTEVARPDEVTGCFGVYLEGRWYDATYTGERAEGAAGLDVAILNDAVLEPLLGGASGSSRLEISSSLTSLIDLTKACDEDGGVLFALRPATLEQVIDVADRGEVMPPKATYFDPKPYAGIFLR